MKQAGWKRRTVLLATVCLTLVSRPAGSQVAAFARSDVTFVSRGDTLAAWLFLPGRSTTPPPVVVMANGWAAVREMATDRYAQAFAQAGLAVLLFEQPTFGASGGTPRQEVDPWRQVQAYRDAISFVRTIGTVDGARIGIWGTSFSGGLVLVVGATDSRVKAVVSQVPATTIYDSYAQRVGDSTRAGLQSLFAADRDAQWRGKPPRMIPIVSDDPAALAALPSHAYRPLTEAAAPAPTWRNTVTLQSLAMTLDFEPWVYARRLARTPLLMIVAESDSITTPEGARQTFATAPKPSSLIVVPGGHFAVYSEHFARTSSAARDWFLDHLR